MSATFVTHRSGAVSLGGPATVRIPARFTAPAPTAATYLRRRVGAIVFVVALLVSFGSVAERSLADRGGEPASVSTIGRTTSDGSHVLGDATSYIVQPGDTIWAIAERLYPASDLSLVVDAMVTVNGGAGIRAGQVLRLP